MAPEHPHVAVAGIFLDARAQFVDRRRLAFQALEEAAVAVIQRPTRPLRGLLRRDCIRMRATSSSMPLPCRLGANVARLA